MLTTSFWITLLGMGIVFGTILLLWGLMAALTALLADRRAPASDSPEAAPVSLTPFPSPGGNALALHPSPGGNALTPFPSPGGRGVRGEGDKARAAAIAVAVALAEQGLSTARPLPAPPTALVSAWQLGMRTRQMYQKGERIKAERCDLPGLARGNKK